jgi:hypothetical protein
MAFEQAPSPRWLPATLLAVLLVVGCGGGGGGGGSGGPDPVSGGAISGQVVKGPVSGATVKAFAISGGFVGAQVGSALTNADGSFVLPVGQHAGPVFLQMSGGAYLDEATGTVMAMRPIDTMTALLPSMVAGTRVDGIQVTPLTAMAQAMATRMAGGLNEANIATANAAVGNYFLVPDILRTPPINPLVPGSAVGANQAMVNYGMTLAAMSQYAKDAGMPASSAFVAAMMNDAADGVFDGQSGDATLTILRDPNGGGLPPPDAGRTGLATAMAAFMNSPMNQSGLAPAGMGPLSQQFGSRGGRMR